VTLLADERSRAASDWDSVLLRALRFLRCAACGYGVAIARPAPPPCPMCASTAWLPERGGRAPEAV
jgi:hypothetical protein